MKALFSTLAATFMIALLAVSVAGAQPRYTLERLEALETPDGVRLDQVRATDMNNRGQVVGRVHTGRSGENWASAAFLFTPGAGMQDLDPDGTYLSRAEAINDRSQVFGRFGTSRYARSGQSGIFLYHPGSGHDFLGSNRQIHTTFEFRDMNTSGELVGGVYSRQKEHFLPYLYSPAEGWINLVPIHPRLGRSQLLAWYINDHGEIAFSSRYGGCGDPGWFFFDRRGSFTGIGLHCDDGTHGLPVHRRRFSKTGRMVGNRNAWTPAESERPFYLGHAQYYKLGRRKIEIHPEGWRASGSDLINARGVIGGTLQEGRSRDTVFTFDERREPALRIEVSAAEFRAFVGGGFQNVVLFDMNDRGDMIGFVRGPDEWFFYRRGEGLLRVRELFAEAGGSEDLMVVRQLNNRGQMLILTALDGLSSPQPRQWFQFDAPNRRDMITYVLSPTTSE